MPIYSSIFDQMGIFFMSIDGNWLKTILHLLCAAQVLLDEAGVELTAPTCTSCHDTSEKIKGFEDALETRDQQVVFQYFTC